MSATLLANELSNLISEAKRKNTDLRNAAEKSLQELKSLPTTSEQQIAADLSRRSTFIEPFLIACNTHNPKFAGSGIVCLQRLVISKGLPKSRLQDALEAFNTCADLGLDVQLKILQALPSLLQNYAADLEGDLLSGALQVCSSLQAVKASTVSGVASATLQQLVTTVFEKVTYEDRHPGDSKATSEVPGADGPIHLRPAAFDAYRVFRDLALAANERSTKFVQFTSLSPETSLELIWSCIDSNSDLFKSHEELMSIIGSNVFPLIIRALTEKLSFPVTVRSIRILDLVLDRYMSRLPGDCEVALNLCTQCLETDGSPAWKRALIMEVLRDFFTDSNHLIDAYAAFDGRESGKPIIQDLMSSFVRLSTEKPGAIGLGQQSTIPTGPPTKNDSINEQAALEVAGGMAGVISSALGVAEVNIAGISSQWSIPKVACMEQLDKNDPPSLPETYPYALVLECLNGLSDSLARMVLPLTVHHEKNRKSSNGPSQTNGTTQRERSNSFRTQSVPLNPMEAQDAPYASRIKTVARFIETCWPAVLATSSTFLNAALDDQYFRNLIKAYQRFAQVAGLLRLSTPRDALMTTLAKAAVPPHVLNAATADPIKSPATESPRVFSNPKSLLSVDSFVSQASSMSTDKDRSISLEQSKPMLTVRNLLCLRALLNLAIALGPTLEKAFAVIVSALKQADLVLSTTSPQRISQRNDPPAVVQAFSAEVAAVESAASRLLESTADYPDDAFMTVLKTFCQLLHGKDEEIGSPMSPKPPPLSSRPSSSPRIPGSPRRTFSGLPGIGSFVEMQSRDYQFVIPKLGTLAELNVSRFTSEEPETSGWTCIVDELITIAKTNDTPRDGRRGATNVLVKLAEATIGEVVTEDPDDRAVVQRRALATLLRLVDEIYSDESDLSPTDLEVQHYVLESLRAILERCGDSLVAGWNRVIAILSGAFEHDRSTHRGHDDEDVKIDWQQVSPEMVSAQIGRTAFAATQLMCSDFMDALPDTVIPSLVELLYRFMCQIEDLNAALTAVTMTWNVSDIIFNRISKEELAAFVQEAAEFDELEEDLKPKLSTSRPAQWLLVLIRLRDAAGQPSKDIRNAAFQTICNVFRNHGEELLPPAWDLLLRTTLLSVARTDSYLYLQEDTADASATRPDKDMSKAIIQGASSVIGQHLRVIEQISKLPSLWEVFLGMLERYLDVEDHSVNAAVYFALARVLSNIEPSSAVWKGPTYRTVSLWLKHMPVTHDESSKQSNQEAFLAYAEAGGEIYRLTKDTISTSQTRTMIDNLYHCVRESDGPLYGADATNLSQLQAKVMQLLKSMRLDQPDIPSCLVTVAAKLSTLHHDTAAEKKSQARPTFIAIASEAIAWLQELVISHISEDELVDSDALPQAVQGLRRIIESKYTFGQEHKGLALWRRATATALALAQPVLAQSERLDRNTKISLWSEYVGIASGIVKANDLHLIDDVAKINEDQDSDMEKYRALRDVLVPRLGDTDLPNDIRMTYARALFEASIVHQTERGELPEPEESPLKDIGKIRRGRVKKVPFSLREDMSYVCWKELIALSSLNDGDASSERKRLAQATAPFLVLRLAIPIRAYIADQPLRGRRPQPLSEKEELLFAFEVIRDLKLEPSALGEGGSKAHLQYLYPLLIQAVATAGDKWSGAEDVLMALQKVIAVLAQS